MIRARWCVLILASVLVACGGDPLPPSPEVDGGDSDAAIDAGALDAMVDAGNVDSAVDAAVCPDDDGDGHPAPPCGDDCDDADATRYPGNSETCDLDDEDCNDATRGVDADSDGDGFESAACCNGPDNCGSDCDDAAVNTNPDATETCNGGIDDDCNGLADTLDGVCVPCDPGYTGFDGECANVDECLTSDFCGTGATACTDVPGTFVCTCGPGYATASPTGALCQNHDECAAATDPCGDGMCVDNAGSYTCTCPLGHRLALSPAITCVDVDECAEGAALCTTVPAAICANTPGSYTCACPAGYVGSARGGGGCTDIDECADGIDDCDDVPGTCRNVPASFDCACPTGYSGTGRGTGSCRWSDPALVGLAVGAGATLSPVFVGAVTTYTLTLAPGATSTTLTPSVAQPTRATITVAGSVVASGASSAVSVSGFAPRVVTVVVTTETGAMRTYTVVVARSSSYLKASNTGAGDFFGASVSLSADGTRLAVGARSEASESTGVGGDQADNGFADAGAVYVFSRSGTTWTQEAYVKASNTDAADQFGVSVSLSADGARLAVGASGEASSASGVGADQTDNSFVRAGAVYVFTRVGTTWTQDAYVKSLSPDINDYFGASVSLSADGMRLAVGASGERSSATDINGDQADDTLVSAGAAYVFLRSSTTWTQEAYVKASNTGAIDYFGYSVALSGDGTRLAVGAPGEDSSATGVNGNQADNTAAESGAVYLFARTGTTWAQDAYVKASNPGVGDQLGTSVSLSADGARLAAGAIGEDSAATGIGGSQSDNSALQSGAVYVYARTGATWAQQAYVKASNTGVSDEFGRSVSLSADGTRLVAGASGEDSSATGIGGNQADNSALDSGAAYVFSRSGTLWTQDAYVKASNSGANDGFSRTAVSLSSDGSRLAVGAQREASSATGIGGDQANDAVNDSGAVYVY